MSVTVTGDNVSFRVYKLNIGGREFQISQHVMESVEGSKLQRISRQANDKSKNEIIFFERPTGAFEAILAYHQTGNLHIPGEMCPGAFKQEMEFWDISPQGLEKCCYHRYMTFLREQNVMRGFIDEAHRNDGHLVKRSTCLAKFRSKAWSVLDNKDGSLLTKVYFSVAVTFIVVSIFVTALGTISVTDRNNTTDTSSSDVTGTATTPVVNSPTSYRKLDQKSTPVPHPPEVANTNMLSSDVNTSDLPYVKWGIWNSTTSVEEIFARFVSSNRSRNISRSMFTNIGVFGSIIPETAETKLLTLATAADTDQIIYIYIEYATNAFFTLELVMRMLSCPTTVRHLFCFQNVIEIIVLSSLYLYGILQVVLDEDYHDDIGILLYLQMLRVIRLLRLLDNVTAYRVLCYTMKVGKKDMFIMLLYLFVGVLLFSNMVYLVERSEDFPSIPATWWWSVVTMTTVGYGDMVPKTPAGKTIGAMCALSGVFMFSLIIPIFVNTFLSIYRYADVEYPAIIELKEDTDDAKKDSV